MIKKKVKEKPVATEPAPPKLVRRRENRKSTFKLGRTIGAKREKLETANQRAIARKKDKQKNFIRLVTTICVFLVLIVASSSLFFSFFDKENETTEELLHESYVLTSTIEIIDEENVGEITSRMKVFIARVERELKTLGYQPLKAVIPRGTIREVDFYLENIPGYIKTTIDRDPAITAEDTDRMVRYLSEQGIAEYSYIDVRLEGKAYWK